MEIHVSNHQRRIRIDLAWLRRFAGHAGPACLAWVGNAAPAVLDALDEVSVAIVSDRKIAEVHAAFMGLATPTDVLTFEHGEIVISAETARAYAEASGRSTHEELALYTVHGLLHLNGFDDTTAACAAQMRAAQRTIVKRCLSLTGPSSLP